MDEIDKIASRIIFLYDEIDRLNKIVDLQANELRKRHSHKTRKDKKPHGKR